MTGFRRKLLRLGSLVLTLIVIFGATRAVVRALPGDPIQTILAETGTTLSESELREDLGLGKPFLPSVAHDLEQAFHGDFGVSLLSHEAIAPVLRHRFLNTLSLTLVALALGLSASLALGLTAAARPGRLADMLCSLTGAIAAALPTPWIGPLLIMIFALWIPVLPTGGNIVLPAVTLALSFAGLWARLIRERVRDSLEHGAAPGARARGIAEWKVTIKYGLAPCAGPLLAYLGTQFGALLAGAFVTEIIFSWNGMGTLLVDSVLRRDYPVVEAGTFIAAAASLLGTAFGDWANDWIDPRARGLITESRG